MPREPLSSFRAREGDERATVQIYDLSTGQLGAVVTIIIKYRAFTHNGATYDLVHWVMFGHTGSGMHSFASWIYGPGQYDRTHIQQVLITLRRLDGLLHFRLYKRKRALVGYTHPPGAQQIGPRLLHNLLSPCGGGGGDGAKSGRAICIKRATNFLQHGIFEGASVLGSRTVMETWKLDYRWIQTSLGAPYKGGVCAAMLLFGLAGVGIAAVYPDSHKPKLPVRYSGNGQIRAR
ncbi:hypothetical protein T492DRAFT_848592 [Pavlovales sp. CCMP2436]|nr:hypothetical protein T492DRAFT_848592 [Pavlovales sp. CCMP2436]